MMKSVNLNLIAAGLLWGTVIPHASAAITLDRTRVIYVSDQKSISLNIINENKQYPFLAQAWLDDAQLQSIDGPLMVLPPIQRVEPGESSVVRITQLPEASQLPQDRESLFYFNLREIPPKSEQPNSLQLALQTKIKVFYRPKAIVAAKDEVWQEKLVFRQTSTGLIVENPTPFYVTLLNMKQTTKKPAGEKVDEFKALMIAPNSSETLALPNLNLSSFTVSYINDHGGYPQLHFTCSNQLCHVMPASKK